MTNRTTATRICQLVDWFTNRPPTTATPSVLVDTGSTTAGRITRLSPIGLTSQLSFALTTDVYRTIRDSIGKQPAETGAILGGSRKLGLVTHIEPDATAAVTGVTYSPDVVKLNRLLRTEWDPAGIDFMGFVHSHPGADPRPSHGDAIYAERILRALPRLDRMAMPIVQTIPNAGSFKVNGFMAVRKDGGLAVTPAPLVEVSAQSVHPSPQLNPFLERVLDAYDPAVMTATRVVAVGVGGSAGYLEKMARMGCGQFVLIDPDVIEPKNIGTQDADPRDIGRPKVDAVADRLERLNPNCHVWTLSCRDSAVDDPGFHRLLREPLPGGPNAVPASALLCAFTDNFEAQDRVQRLGLHFGVPTLSASVYASGRGVEIAFAAPGLTKACIRCAQSSRYRAYLKHNFRNDVTSDGTPFLATDRLNESKQVVTLALLHALSPVADASHPATIRYRGWMDRIADRNLVLTRLDPDSPLPSFRPLAAVTDGRCVMDETVWTMPTPDGPDSPDGACPDCGGTGDLNECLGSFTDTRRMTDTFGQHRRVVPHPVGAAG